MKLTKDQLEEIRNQQEQSFNTKRVTSPGLEKNFTKCQLAIMGERMKMVRK